jgi:HAD superfamily hydrolase (TIGR01549 family)
MPRVALFDLDNTLLDRTAPFARWARLFVAEHGLGADAIATLVAEDRDGFRDRTEFIAFLLDRFGVNLDPDDYYRVYLDGFAGEDAVFTGLDALRDDGWLVGVVTNGLTMTQNSKIDRTGLRRHVDAVCVSETAGVWKPDPAIFETALRALGVDPAADRSGYWMVGDALHADIAGGVAAGIPTIWLHRDRDLPADGPKPHHSVGSILDAFAVIGEELAA